MFLPARGHRRTCSPQPRPVRGDCPTPGSRERPVGAEDHRRSRPTDPGRLDGWHRGAAGGGDATSWVDGCTGLGSLLCTPTVRTKLFENRITRCFVAIIRS